MTITVDEVREALRKDDFQYNNSEIGRLIEVAKAALYTEIGYKDIQSGLCEVVPAENRQEFDKLSDSYIIEYVRGFLDQVDNSKTLTILAVQCESLLSEKED